MSGSIENAVWQDYSESMKLGIQRYNKLQRVMYVGIMASEIYYVWVWYSSSLHFISVGKDYHSWL